MLVAVKCAIYFEKMSIHTMATMKLDAAMSKNKERGSELCKYLAFVHFRNIFRFTDYVAFAITTLRVEQLLLLCYY